MRWVAIIFYLTCSLAAWGAIGELGLPGGSLTTLFITAILSFVAVLVHETGHAIAALLVGGRVILLVALPFELRFRPVRLGLAPRRAHRDIGGYVHFVWPPGHGRRQAMFVSVAGPLANFALVPVVLLLGALAASWFGDVGLPGRSILDSGPLPSDAEVLASIEMASWRRAAEASWLISTALTIISVGMGAANLIPYGGSDGAEILRAWKLHRLA